MEARDQRSKVGGKRIAKSEQRIYFGVNVRYDAKLY